MTGSTFNISLVTTSHLFSYTLIVCKNLQDPNCNVIEALDLVDGIIKTIKGIQNENDSEFTKIFIEANFLISLIGETIKMLRVALRQN